MPQVNRFAIALLLVAMTALSGCDGREPPADSTGPAAVSAADAKMTELADRYVAAALDRQPVLAYFANLPAPAHDRLLDNSLGALAEWHTVEDRIHAEIAAVDESALSPDEWVAWGVLKETLEASRGLRVCRSELWQTVNHMDGWHLELSFLATRQPVATPADREAALRRWASLPRYIDTEIVNLTKGLGEGYSAAKPVAQAMLKQIEQMAAAPAEEWPLYAMAERTDDAEFHTALRTLIDTDIRAAVTRFRDFLAETYIPAARETLPVTSLPDGTACYRAMLRDYTTLDRDPAAVYALGEETVSANRSRVLALGSELFGLEDLDAIVAHVQEAPDNHFETETALVEHSRATVEAARAKVAPLFVSMPSASVVVEPFPEYQRGSGLSSHYQPPGSAGQPGEYRISLDFWRDETVGGAEITAVHEAWPGHHLQISLTLAQGDQHPILRFGFNSGYVEGWARYAEQLAEEAGIYTVDYARITRRLWPARGMMLDPGIHLLGWTKEQAVDFFMESGKFSRDEAEAGVTRIAAIPGQLAAYDSGALVIFGLRAEAEERLGGQFDLRAFHKHVLENGSLPLWQLQEHVRRWIAAQSESR
ncbi:MAG: DUF885 domain-containing protein [Gammaproteobacteria bacterium]